MNLPHTIEGSDACSSSRLQSFDTVVPDGILCYNSIGKKRKNRESYPADEGGGRAMAANREGSGALADIKRKLREAMGQRRAEMKDAYCRAADESIRFAVLLSDAYRAAESLFVYVSMPGEPDTRGILAAALRVGKRVYVPKCMARPVMLAARISDVNELAPGAMSIPEPLRWEETAAPGEIDLILAPCVAASRRGARLGHGGGYYDAFLRGCRSVKACLCYEWMLTEDIPMSAQDVWMDAVVTEKGWTRCASGDESLR